MCNDHEADPWKVNITLMYTQDSTSFVQPSPYNVVGVAKKAVASSKSQARPKNEKSLRELLEEQDVGECSES